MSYEFTVNDGRMEGVFSGTHNPPFTFGCFIKYATHPISNQWLMAWAPTTADVSPSVELILLNVDDAYRLNGINASAAYQATNFTAGAGEYDGVWHGVVCVMASSTSRRLIVGELSNETEDVDSHDIGTAYKYLKFNSSMFEAGEAGVKGAEYFTYNGVMSDADITSYLAGTKVTSLVGSANVLSYHSLFTDDDSPNSEGPAGTNPEMSLNGTAGSWVSDHPTRLGTVWINDAATKDGGEVLQTYPGAGNWADGTITMTTAPDVTGLTPPLYVLVETATGALAYRAVTVGTTGPTILVPTGPWR